MLYKDYAPTPFDRAGAFLPEQGDWLVAPVGRNRDSGALEESNFATCLAILGDESETVEVHRFGHWAVGWFELILVKPDTHEAHRLEEIARGLADYPVLDEEDYSMREWEEIGECWRWASTADRVHMVQESQRQGYDVSIFAARRDECPSISAEAAGLH